MPENIVRTVPENTVYKKKPENNVRTVPENNEKCQRTL